MTNFIPYSLKRVFEPWKLTTFSSNVWIITLFVLSVFIVNPKGNFPLNDDWSYAKSVLRFQNEHKIDIGMWPAMTLLTQILWGSLFTSLFGFSFTVLRFSTLISSLIGLLVLNKLAFRISGKVIYGFIAALTLLFNPFYFNLSNTFMTDVNFNTLLLVGVYFAYDFFQSGSKVSFFLVFLFSCLLVLLRQYGIVLPVCFAFSFFFQREKKWLFLVASLVFVAGIVAVLRYYEHYLKGILPPTSAYKFSGDVNPSQRAFWDVFFINLKARYAYVIFHVLFYSFPLMLFIAKPVIAGFNKWKVLLLFMVILTLVYFVFRNTGFQMPNVFSDMAVGTETFYQTLKGTDDGYGHTYNRIFELTMPYVEFVFIAFSLTTIFLHFYKIRTSYLTQNKQLLVFLVLLSAGYIFMIIITESYFDRYHIPIITLFLVFICYLNLSYKYTPVSAIILLVLLAYLSVGGTKDYLELRRTTWGAYSDLRKDSTINPEKINAGFEIYNWNDGKVSWWWEFMNIDNFDYLIQYQAEPGFTLLRSCAFQRYFPYKKDKINIFVRNEKKK